MGKAKNKVEDLKGRAKEALGDLTDDDELKVRGKFDQASAAVKDKAEDLKDKATEAVGKAKKKINEMTSDDDSE